MEFPRTGVQSTTYIDLSRPSNAPTRRLLGLNASEVQTLAPGEELDLQTIRYLLERVARLCPGMIYVLDTTILSVITMTGESNEMFNHIRCNIASIPFGGMVLVPMCVDNHHFLLVFRKCRNETGLLWDVLVYDSMLLRLRLDSQNGNTISSNSWKFFRSLVNFLFRALFSFCIPAQNIYIDLIWCPQQPNGYDCGVAVCLNAMDVIVGGGQPSTRTIARSVCVVPRFDEWTIESPSLTGLLEDSDPISSTNFYWSAGRWLVFQLCRRAVDRFPVNNDAIAARNSVSTRLEDLQVSAQPRDPFIDEGQGSSLPLAIQRSKWIVKAWWMSKERLLLLMAQLYGKATNLGAYTGTFGERDMHVFIQTISVSVNPMHETRHLEVREAALESAWHDPEIISELAVDIQSAWLALDGVRPPEWFGRGELRAGEVSSEDLGTNYIPKS